MDYDKNKAHYVVATGIILKDGKFLIAKRAMHEKAFPEKWTVPGGKLNMSDYSLKEQDTTSGQWYYVLENLLRREVKEEVNLEIENIRYLTSLVYIRSDGIPTLTISLFADYQFGEVKLCKDLTEFAWVNLEEAKNYDLIDGIYDELVEVSRIIKNGGIFEWKK
jgi:8-oxo-dGTP diphosphatase